MTAPSPSGDGKTDDVMREVPYDFDALPRLALDLLRLGKIKPMDVAVLLVIVRYRKGANTFAWVPTRIICEMTGLSETSVHRSRRCLAAAKLIERVKCEIPDPEDLKNSTGYRFEFTCARVSPETGRGCLQRHPKEMELMETE